MRAELVAMRQHGQAVRNGRTCEGGTRDINELTKFEYGFFKPL